MNQEKIGQFIKNIRKQNNLTQADFAKKYNVTYQAVSKWENGKNLPDVSLIKQICKDYNIDINELLDGEFKEKKKIKFYVIFGIVILILVSIICFIIFHNDDFNFKTLSSGCNNFTISGSLSYNNKKSSIYISNVNYCGESNNIEYRKIECGLYEKHQDTETLISTSNYNNKVIKLDEFLKGLEFTIDNYNRTCNDYSDDSLFLRIKATDKNNETTIYEIPLTLKEC